MVVDVRCKLAVLCDHVKKWRKKIVNKRDGWQGIFIGYWVCTQFAIYVQVLSGDIGRTISVLERNECIYHRTNSVKFLLHA